MNYFNVYNIRTLVSDLLCSVCLFIGYLTVIVICVCVCVLYAYFKERVRIMAVDSGDKKLS